METTTHPNQTEPVSSGLATCLESILENINSQCMFIKINHVAKKVEDAFEDNPDLVGIIVVDEEEHLMGMISRRRFMEIYSKPFRKELHNKKPLKLRVTSKSFSTTRYSR